MQQLQHPIPTVPRVICAGEDMQSTKEHIDESVRQQGWHARAAGEGGGAEALRVAAHGRGGAAAGGAEALRECKERAQRQRRRHQLRRRVLLCTHAQASAYLKTLQNMRGAIEEAAEVLQER
eukprot:153679-Chlamydomonas_euryale.AAC.1